MVFVNFIARKIVVCSNSMLSNNTIAPLQPALDDNLLLIRISRNNNHLFQFLCYKSYLLITINNNNHTAIKYRTSNK